MNTISNNTMGRPSFFWIAITSFFSYCTILTFHLINLTFFYPHKMNFKFFLSNTKLGYFSFLGDDGECLTAIWLSCPFCPPVRSYFTWYLIAEFSSQSCPTWSWSMFGRLHLPSRRLVAQHMVTETKERCVICPQTAPRRPKVSLPREMAGILTLQLPALFQHLLACYQDIYHDNITSLYKYLGPSCVQTKNNVK